MLKLRATTALAAEIARIDRQRFNEAVASGLYTCAPETVAGRARSFGLVDLVVLFIYGRLLDEGITPRHAGAAACRLLTYFQEMPLVGEEWMKLDHIVYVVFEGQPLTSAWRQSGALDRGAVLLGGREVLSERKWNLKLIRERISARLREEDEERVIGPIGIED
ncbi:hypothetical protein [Ancylobacter pratisalsi]|uniref:Uncharacterized protein n=1 Tax=Ancylobacter pratisalsi TaxID=1745854 RepID=A0A6P1YJ34_9HYPH|nr:hypothetical protein [Ancylobacter pratisalsi]QIB32671.1 hypothetical protein G3A50_02360 [Ancylobacter pratisalsi]